MSSKSLFLLLVVVLFFACGTDDVVPGNTPLENFRKVWIINEGNFNSGNGSITLYYPDTSVIQQNAYKAANGLKLGDVVQSVYFTDSLAFIIVNNSQKIEVVNKRNLSRLATISGFASPRYMQAYGNKAIVTELYDQRIYIVDISGFFIDTSIPINGWSEQLAMVGNNIYITERMRPNLNAGDNYPMQKQVLVFSTITESIIDSIPFITTAPNASLAPTGDIVVDYDGKIWVPTQEDTVAPIPPAIFTIDPATDVSDEGALSANGHAITNLCINGDGNKMYYIGNNKVYRSNNFQNQTVTSFTQMTNPGGSILYGLGVDPTNGDIYVSDAIDYLQSGVIFRYDASGNPIDTFTAGIIPGDFAFD